MTSCSCARCWCSARSARDGSRTPKRSSAGWTRSAERDGVRPAAFRQVCRAELMLASGDSSVPGWRGTGSAPSGCVRFSSRWSHPDRDGTVGAVRRRDGAERACLVRRRRGRGARARRCSAPAGRVRCRCSTPDNPRLDYPASGLVLFALGAWGLLRRVAPAEDALRLLALADRFAYNRMIPTMRGSGSRPRPRKPRPACSPGCRPSTGTAAPPGLLTQARLAVERLPG